MKSFKPVRIALAAALLLALGATSTSLAKKKPNSPLSDEAAAGITDRGRMLAQYETAADQAIKAVMNHHPDQGTIDHYIGSKTPDGWVVAFGRFNDQHDKFLVVYDAVREPNTADFNVKRHDPPQEDDGFYYSAARAIDAATRDFGISNRPYHAAILPGPSNQMYVYLIPAPTPAGVYPLGADIRYLISSDGATIVERRQLHRTIIAESGPVPQGAQLAGGFHSHVLTDVPEDTDVFYVLTRKPSRPEYIGAGGHAYEIAVDGTIKVMK